MTDERLDIDNASVSEPVAEVGLCGQTDLRTGRACILPVRHDGDCEFVPPDAVELVVRDRKH